MSEINIASYVISPFNNPLYAYRLLRTHDLPFHLTPSRTSDLSYGRNQEPSVPYLSQSSSASFSRKSFVSSTVPLYLRLHFSPVHSLTMLIFQLCFCIFFFSLYFIPSCEGQTLINSSIISKTPINPLPRGADFDSIKPEVGRCESSPPARGRHMQCINNYTTP